MGLVTNTAGLNDHGLNASAWTGVQKAVQEGLVWQADYVESVDTRDYVKNLSALAALGYDLVIAGGAGLEEAALQAAAEHPGTRFLGLDQDLSAQPPSNLTVVTFPEEQGGFLAGALAALTTRTGIVGAVCEASWLDLSWRYCEGFRLGALHEDQGITVLISYHENATPETIFQDEAWGAEAAAEVLNLGADVIFGVGGRPAQGALRRAAQGGVFSIGSVQDQYFETREARPVLLSSAVPQADGIVLEHIRLLASGQTPTARLTGAMTLVPWHEADRLVPFSAQTTLEALKARLVDGTLPVQPVQPR